MKALQKILPILLAAALLLTACGGGGEEASAPDRLPTPDVAKLAEDMLNSVAMEDELMALDAQVVGNLYEYDEECIAEFALYTSSTMSTPEEVAVFVAADEESMEYVDEMIQLRLQNLEFSYADYAPQEMPKIENAKVMTKGLYTALVVCADPGPAEDVFEKAFA